MNKGLISIAALAAAVVLFFAFNIVGTSVLRGARADLTEGNLYTLSAGSRNVAKKLPEPIDLTFYYSEKAANDVPQIKSYATRVKEVLREYEQSSGGKIRLDIINPEPFSEEQDKADQAGLVGAPTGRGGDRLYFGLVAENSTGIPKTIPFFDPRKEGFLEYDLTRMIYLLSDAAKKKVGVMSWLPIEGMPMNPMTGQRGPQAWQIVTQMKEVFDVVKVETTAKEVPADINVLIVVHPKNPPTDAQYAIDQFVLRGGRLLLFVDPLCEADVPPGVDRMQAMQIPKNSDLPTLMSAWGVELESGKVAGDGKRAMRLQGGTQTRPEIVTVLSYLQLTADDFAPNDPITGGINTVRMISAGVLKAKSGAATAFEPLITTSKEAAPLAASELAAFPDWKGLLGKFVPSGSELTLAARVSGKVKSAFPDGAPKATTPPAEGQPPASEPKGPHIAESAEPITVVVFADCDMLRDEVWGQELRFGQVSLGFQKSADNGELVIGAVDNLGGSSDVMSLRSRGSFTRPFERVEEIQKEAQKNFAAKEAELDKKLQEIEGEINQLQQQRPDGQATMFLTPEQQVKLEEAQRQRLETRKQKRAVQHELRKDIETLGTGLKVANMTIMPGIVALVAVGMGMFRANRRRADRARPSART